MLLRADEPYEQVIQAAHELGPDVHIHVTGNYRKANLDPVSVPANVTLLGYVSESEYVTLLNSVDATMDLTTRDNCLVCGAYETVAVGKPQILSDTSAIRQYFRKGVIYTQHPVESLIDSIKAIIERKDHLQLEAIDLKRLLNNDWEQRRIELEMRLAELLNSGGRTR